MDYLDSTVKTTGNTNQDTSIEVTEKNENEQGTGMLKRNAESTAIDATEKENIMTYQRGRRATSVAAVCHDVTETETLTVIETITGNQTHLGTDSTGGMHFFYFFWFSWIVQSFHYLL